MNKSSLFCYQCQREQMNSTAGATAASWVYCRHCGMTVRETCQHGTVLMDITETHKMQCPNR